MGAGLGDGAVSVVAIALIVGLVAFRATTRNDAQAADRLVGNEEQWSPC
jgi:hypothetical protein